MVPLKLRERKARYIIRAKKGGESYKHISRDLKLSISLIKRVWIYYLDNSEILPIKMGKRKMKEITEDEEKIVIKTYMHQKVRARIETIELEYGMNIPHNRIHKILIKNKLVKEDIKKKKPRKK